MVAPKQDAWPWANPQAFEMSPEERIRAVLSVKTPDDQRFLSKFWEQQCSLRQMQRISDKQTNVTFAFKVDRYYCNLSGNLHGGAQAMIYDLLTSLAVQSIGKGTSWSNGGVSRELAVRFLRPAPEGTELLLECEVIHMGKSLSLLRGTIKREADGAIISTCEHDKAAVATKPGWKL